MKQFAVYVAVQLLAYAIDMGTFLVVLGAVQVSPVMANVCAKLAAGIVAFALHRNYTFGAKAEHPSTQAIKYFVLLLANIPLATLLMWIALQFTTWAALAKLVADVVAVALTFLLTKTLVFGAAKNSQDRTPEAGTRNS